MRHQDDVVPDPLQGWVVVGRVGRPHGTGGELTVEVRTDDPEARYADGAVLHRAGGKPPRPLDLPALVVAGHRWHLVSGRDTLLLTLQGIADRAGAESLRDTLLLVDPSGDPELADEDEFYDHQLLGLAAELPDGTRIGTVTDVLHPPGADLLAVRRLEGEEVLLPFVRAVVPTVDVAGRRLVVTPPPGLLNDVDVDVDAAPVPDRSGEGVETGR